jgi:hypothetical protein
MSKCWVWKMMEKAGFAVTHCYPKTAQFSGFLERIAAPHGGAGELDSEKG